LTEPMTLRGGLDGGASKARAKPKTHALKCWPPFFEAISAGRKTHDLRRVTDRDFRVGDRMELQEFDPTAERYTGRAITVEITYITSADIPCALSKGALHDDFCILSIRLV
jgi:hypothetical protein